MLRVRALLDALDAGDGEDCAPFLTARPYTAAAPVTGPIPPILNTLSEDASLEAPAAAVVASAAAAAVVSVVEDELPQAVKEAAIASARLKLKTLFFIIDSSSGTCYHDNRSMLCRVAVKRLKIILNYREFVSKCQANLFFNEKIVAVWLCSARTATTRAGVPLRNGGSD